MPSLFRSKKVTPIVGEDEVLWGVARREGHSDTDDPIPHEGIVQHAFLFGDDESAICGYKPPKRLSRADSTPRAQLALSGPDNPRCPKCVALIGPQDSADDEVGAETTARDDRAAESVEQTTADAGSASTVAGQDRADEPPPRAPDWSPRSTQADQADVDADEETGDGDQADDEEQAEDGSTGRRRSRVRRGGRVTLAAGRRSVVTQLPPKAHGLAIAAEIEGEAGDLRVQSVAVRDDGTARITLNRTTDHEIELLWFIVSGRRHPGF